MSRLATPAKVAPASPLNRAKAVGEVYGLPLIVVVDRDGATSPAESGVVKSTLMDPVPLGFDDVINCEVGFDRSTPDR